MGQGYSAFWVGLGGASQHSQAPEQIGTSANVVNGKTRYSAWYELVPGGGTQILPLANFGHVTFTSASATAGGHTGSISHPNWTARQTQLSSSGAIGFPDAGGGSQPSWGGAGA